MDLTDYEREIARKIAKLMIVGAFKYISVSGLTPEQIDSEYERVTKEFDQLPPDKIGTTE
jgi:hypothetical protein